MRTFLLVSLLAFVGAANLEAQTQPAAPPQNVAGLPLYPGMRVRVTSSSLVTPLVGSFLQSRGDTLFFTEEAAGRGVWSLALNQISKLETTIGEQSGHRHNILKGAAIGAIIGGGECNAGEMTQRGKDLRLERGQQLNNRTSADTGVQ